MGKSFHFFRVSKQLFIFLKGEVANSGLAVIREIHHVARGIEWQISPLYQFSAELPQGGELLVDRRASDDLFPQFCIGLDFARSDGADVGCIVEEGRDRALEVLPLLDVP